MPRECFVPMVLGLFVMLIGGPVAAVDSVRGKLLYENSCGTCHASALHVRERRESRSFGDIRAQVFRWSTAAKLQWTDEEIQDVTDYLNTSFYRYPCEPEQCSLPLDEN